MFGVGGGCWVVLSKALSQGLGVVCWMFDDLVQLGWVLCVGFWVLGAWCWVLGVGCWLFGDGCWLFDVVRWVLGDLV